MQQRVTTQAGTAGGVRPLVLTVDDEPETSRFIVTVLERRFRVATAADGEAGLARALELRPDLILTDMMMPKMSGDRLVREIRKHPELEGVPIVLLTAWSDDELRVRLLQEGALDYITKPFSGEELLSRVSNLVAIKRARELLQEELQEKGRDLDALAGEVVARSRDLQAALETARLERDRAERASQAKSQFLGLVSHELMTPISALRLMCDRMARDQETPLGPRHRDFVQRMIGLCSRLTGTVTSILEHVRVEGGRLVVRSAPFDLPALVHDLLEEVRPQADAKKLELRLEVARDLPPARSDERLVRVILANLTSNAVKFTPEGSIVVRVAYAHGAHRVEVQDSGPGIAPEDRERIFEPFLQLEPLFHKHQPGIGLGLTLAREMASALGGEVSLLPSSGPGSTFAVVLPEPGETVASVSFREQQAAAGGNGGSAHRDG